MFSKNIKTQPKKLNKHLLNNYATNLLTLTHKILILLKIK